MIVEGDWGTSVTKTVKNKLHIYFQSRKKSGGGECRVEAEDGAQRAAVFFESDEGEWTGPRSGPEDRRSNETNVSKEFRSLQRNLV